MGGDRRSVRLMAQRARDHLPQVSTISPATGAPRSPSSRWCSATSATIARPASPSPAIPPTASTASTASSCPMRKARTSSPASARRHPISKMAGREGRAQRHQRARSRDTAYPTLEESFPQVYGELLKIAKRLEKHFKDCRTWNSRSSADASSCCRPATANAPPKPPCASRVDMADREALIDRRTALMRVDPVQLEQLLHPRLDPAAAKKTVIARGLARLAGRRLRRSGVLAPTRRSRFRRPGRKVILVRIETSPEDIHGMQVARGNPDRARRNDQSRRGGRAWDGQMLRRGMLRRSKSTTTTAR